jgi:hypothetical protein
MSRRLLLPLLTFTLLAVVAAPAIAIRVSAIRATMIARAASYAHDHGARRADDIHAHGVSTSANRGRGCVTFLSGDDRIRIAATIQRVQNHYELLNVVTLKVAHNRRDACR